MSKSKRHTPNLSKLDKRMSGPRQARGRTAAERQKAFEEATATFEAAPEPGRTVTVEPAHIVTMPTLFQPREGSLISHTNWEHVHKLRKHVAHVGELDAPVLVRIAGQWVCVDGHHRLAAYRQSGFDHPINCH